jgi:hypothetical protein
MTDGQVNWLRRSLTIADVRRRKPVVHHAYVEDEENLGIPRSFLRESATKGHSMEDFTSESSWAPKLVAPEDALWAPDQDDDHESLTLIDSVSGEKSEEFFSSDQKRGISAILKALAMSMDGIAMFHSEQAAAKVCLSLIRTIKRRTLVICPPGSSFSMWETVIGRFLPDASVGYLRDGDRGTFNDHIILTTMDHLIRAVDSDGVISDEFGFIISHHIHRMDPAKWARAVGFFDAGRRLGLTVPSASFSEGLSRIYSYHLGRPVFVAKSDSTLPRIRKVQTGWKVSSWDRANPQFISKESILKHICVNTKYNKSVVEQVVLALKAGRRIAIFSDKVLHLKALGLMVNAAWAGSSISTGYVLEGMSPDEVYESSNCDVILTTFDFAKSFPEVPELDTVVLATPVRDPLQAANVCRLKDPDKKDPVIVDMRCDDVPVCKDYGRSRDAAYLRSYGEEVAR